MNKFIEVLLTVMALVGMYCAMPKSAVPAGSPMVQSGQQQVLIADGSDPMPLCRGRKCGTR